jgi:HK97 family phage prohead protease
MLTKNTTAVKVKAGPEDGLAEGEFIVYPSTFTREPDAVNDVVAPGAFLKSLERWDQSGNVLPGLYGHRTDDPDYYVASAIDTGEDEHGWWVKGAFDMDSPKGPQVYRLVKGRRLNQLSFAYDVIDQAEVELGDGVKANELRELDVYEFSFVPVGANQDTGVVAVKAIVEGVQAELKAGRTLSAKNETELRGAYEAIGKVLDSLDAGAPPAAGGAGNIDAGKASGTDSSSHTSVMPAGRSAGPNPSVATALLEADLALSA